jgi:hypothetical protein
MGALTQYKSHSGEKYSNFGKFAYKGKGVYVHEDQRPYKKSVPVMSTQMMQQTIQELREENDRLRQKLERFEKLVALED